EGKGEAEDIQQAHAWWRKAAEQGNAEAQFNLGVMYATGQGVPQDIQQVVTWLRKAAEQGNAEAQFNLGVMYA
ncbi:tetratricopeptide repeat protein, partial [Aeromonas caviae]|uniref:tetratricopeptide repeat protein n=1 Tax=Aeromonas caviae TaxID=648 RepID=UPI001FB9780D